MALIPSVRQGQVQAGISKARSQAIKVHCSEAITANDIIVVTGIHAPSNVLSVAKADANDITKCRGPFYVADYAAAVGDITPLALPWKLITGVSTSGSHVGKAVYLADTPGNVLLTQPAVVADNFSSRQRSPRWSCGNGQRGCYRSYDGTHELERGPCRCYCDRR